MFSSLDASTALHAIDVYTFYMTGIRHILDPLTAISLGLVTPEQLGFPPAALAYFNILKGST